MKKVFIRGMVALKENPRVENGARFVLMCLVTSAILVACGPSQAELDDQATKVAANRSATQTAEAPTPTNTPTPTPTPTHTPTPTKTPTPTYTPTPTPTPIPTPPIPTAWYESAQYPFAIQYPAHWAEQPKQEDVTALYAPDATLSVAFGIVEEDLVALGVGEMTLEEYADLSLWLLTEAFEDYELLSRQRTVNAQGLPVQILVFTAGPGGIFKFSKLIYLHENKIAFNATYYGFKAKHQELEPLIEFSFSTFQVAARSEKIELVAQIGGDASDVFVQGEYAYVAGGLRSGLRVIDVSNPAAPIEVGSHATPGALDSVYVSGSYVYVAAGPSGLQVVDVSNPTAPVDVGSHATPDYAHGVYVSGSYAYVAAHTSGLQVVDVSNPASPYEVGFCDTPGWAFDVYVSDAYAYVADFDGGLRVIDVSNPASPFEVGSYVTPGFAGTVFVSGSYAYVTAGASGLRVIDVSDPAAPVEVGSYTVDQAYGVHVSGSYAYMGGSVGLQVADISDPTAPMKVGSHRTPGSAENVYVSGQYAYLAAGVEGLFIVRMEQD